MRVVILEDNLDRQAAMHACIADKFPAFVVEIFSSAQLLIARLKETGLYDIALVSLDHDLELIDNSDGQLSDPGTGVDAAEWLASQPAVAPVIVHTTNTVGGDRMVELLAGADWNVKRVVPYGDDEWISEVWRPLLRDSIVSDVPAMGLALQGIQIARCGLRESYPVEWMISEVLKAGAATLGFDRGLPLEFGYLKHESCWGSIAGVGMPVLRNYGTGHQFQLLEAIADSEPDTDRPVDLAAAVISEEARDELNKLNVRSVQIKIIKINRGMEAVLFVASSDGTRLQSRQAQTVLQTLSCLISMLLRMELMAESRQNPTSTSDTAADPEESLTDLRGNT